MIILLELDRNVIERFSLRVIRRIFERDSNHFVNLIITLFFKVLNKIPDHFPGFFHQVLESCLLPSTTPGTFMEQTALIIFLRNCFNSMEEEMVREQIKKLISISTWISLQQVRFNYTFY